MRTFRTLILFLGLMAALASLLQPHRLAAQGMKQDNGNCAFNGQVVFSCWNFNAGLDMPTSLADYPEFLPFLKGWDFRINLPHVRLQPAHTALGSAATMVGVVEGGSDVNAGTFEAYGHTNNAIWLFRVAQSDGQAYYKVLPSRRGLATSEVENVLSLTADWKRVGPMGGPRLRMERLAAAVIGEGLGKTTIYLVARGEDNKLYFTSRRIDSTSTSSWPISWTSLGISTTSRPALSAAFDGRLALVWHDSSNSQLKIQLYMPASNTWGPTVIAALGAPGAPQLVWDGTALNLFFLANERVQHVFALSADALRFQDQKMVSNARLVRQDNFDVLWFNNRLHAVIHEKGTGSTGVWYTTTTTPPGTPSRWTEASHTGLVSAQAARITVLKENIFVIGVDATGRVAYSRKDPNAPGKDIAGAGGSDRWLSRGVPIDPGTAGSYGGVETLSFNDDIYVTATRQDASQGLHIVNFSRAATKQFLVDKLKLKLMYGNDGARSRSTSNPFAVAAKGEIPMIGYFDNDQRADLLKVVPLNGNNAVSIKVAFPKDSYGSDQVWHSFFTLAGGVPLVGDFNGDGMDDFVSFTQQKQYDVGGKIIGNAPVWVALSDGTRFGSMQLWHTFFSLKGETPLIGDFDGNGMDDIATVTHNPYYDAAGNKVGDAVVWVALSDGTKFGPSKIWHTSFSPKGEVPLVGNFDGDAAGTDDLVSFAQKAQYDASGKIIGNAPVRVVLSDGAKFGPSYVWHTFFSLAPEIPRVGDLNLDGKDDVVTFLRDNPTNDQNRDIYVAYSLGYKFDRSATWLSQFVGSEQIPYIGTDGGTLGTITGRTNDYKRFMPTIYAFHANGSVHTTTVMSSPAFPAGAPWERYKWFPEKGLGAMQFPEWIWESSKACVPAGNRFVLLGAAGYGSPTEMASSVRMGARAPHILQELGHMIFANCFRSDPARDPFSLYKPIYETPWKEGGFGALEIADICKANDTNDYYDCRDEDRFQKAEHIFLGLMVNYRWDGDKYRERIQSETNPVYQGQLAAAYQWLKQNWFNGLEFKTGPAINAGLAQNGLQCLPGECALPQSVLTATVPEPVGD
jgi:hypothetical protein